MAETFLTTRHGFIKEIPLYRYDIADSVIADAEKLKRLKSWLRNKSGFPVYAIKDSHFLTYEQLSPKDLNRQYFFCKTTAIELPFENIQLISSLIGSILKDSLTKEFNQFLQQNIFVISEEIIYPFKLLKVIEFNVEVFHTGFYMIHFLPSTKIVSVESPITAEYLDSLKHGLNKANKTDVQCTFIDKNKQSRFKLNFADNKAFENVRSQLENGSIYLATFDYQFLANYSSDIFHKIIDATSKKISDILWFTDKLLSKVILPDHYNLSPDKYFKTEIVDLDKKHNLLVGCQYNEDITLYSASPTRYGLRIEYARNKISPDEVLISFIKGNIISEKLHGLTFPTTMKGAIAVKEESGKPYLQDIFIERKINAQTANKQSAAYYNGIYKPVNNWTIQPILYKTKDISLFKELLSAFNKNATGFNILEPYVIANDTDDLSIIAQQIRNQKKVFIPVICQYQMPNNLIQAIKGLKKRYQIYLGDIFDSKDNRSRLSNYVCKCLEKMDGIVTLIADTTIPDSGYFIGVDLGHTTTGEGRFSNLGAAIFNNHGLLLDHYVLQMIPRNESLYFSDCKKVFEELKRKIINKKLIAPTHIVIHRDGKLHSKDVDSIISALKAVWGEINVDIVEIIKSGFPIMIIKNEKRKAVNPASGSSYQNVENKYALLVTNTQADEHETTIRPIIIKHKFGETPFNIIVEQVYWLTKIYTNNLFNCTRLPATTQKANNISGTSKKTIHQATYLG